MTEQLQYGRKRRGIIKELDEKISDWILSITDDEVSAACREDTIVTGGSIASMLLGEKVNDFDIYFKTKKTTKLVAEYYCKVFNELNKLNTGVDVKEYAPYVKEETIKNCKGEEEDRIVIHIQSAGVVGEAQESYKYFESRPAAETESFVESLCGVKNENTKIKYRPVFMSGNAITLSDDIQLVTRFYGDPEKIHSNYDFVHAMNYFEYKGSHLVLHPEALESLLSRTLIYRGSLYPIASLFRTKKFLERGWRISAGEQLKIAWQISELDLTKYENIREQLTGVDQAYLFQLIQALKDVTSDKINSSYVGTIIDRIFG